MGRKRSTQRLNVFMNGRLVGTLQKVSAGGLSFQYADSWIQWQRARPLSLSIPLSEEVYNGDVVYNYFDNLLPDNRQIRERIQAKFKIATNQCFDILSYIGKDCVGAVQLLSDSITDDFELSQAVGTKLTNLQIDRLLHNYRSAPLGMDDNADFRISIAGAQEKTALLKMNNAWYLPHADTATSHIFKLPIGYIKHADMDLSDSLENEYVCSRILEAYNIPVATNSIQNFGDSRALVVERFDRKWSDDTILRLPQEDLCQALGLPAALKYQSDGGPGILDIMNLLTKSSNAMYDRAVFMQTIFLFWVMGAIDGHAKNFSIYIKPNNQYRLTPIYDVLSAYPLIAQGNLDPRKIKMSMAVQGKNKHYKWHDIQVRHWLETAELCKFPAENMQKIIEDSFDTMPKVLNSVEQHCTEEQQDKVFKHIAKGMLKLRDNKAK